MIQTTSKYGRLKYVTTLADLVALGGATGTLTLDNLPPGVVVTQVLIKPTTATLGGGASAVTAAPKIGGAAIGSAISTFTTAGGINSSAGVAGSLTANNALTLDMAVTGGTLGALTSGQFETTVNYIPMGP
jgi:hypothetical protein